MGLFSGFGDWLSSVLGGRTVDDPVFGRLSYCEVGGHPTRSFWSGDDYYFSPTETTIPVTIRGGVDGPLPAEREFHLRMEERFEGIMEIVEPIIDQVFQDRLGRPLGKHIWDEIQFFGFDAEDALGQPPKWGVDFVSTGEENWLEITVSFVGEEVQPPIVGGLGQGSFI